MLAAINSDDVIYYCELPVRKAEISFQHVTATLKPIPDSVIFPEWPLSDDSSTERLTQAPLLPANNQIFIKRPNLSLYDIFERSKVVYGEAT